MLRIGVAAMFQAVPRQGDRMTPISDEVLATLVTTALALQFTAFGWRILREIQLGDENRRTWLLVTDYLIVISMVATALVCIVLPFAGKKDDGLIALTLSLAYIVIAMHPINTAAHYRVFSRYGRSKYRAQNRDVPYISDQEWLALAVTFAAVAGTLYSHLGYFHLGR
jgi:hypothetical protein